MAPAICSRSCGDVSAAVRIFSPPRLLIQEPRGEQGQGHVVMPRETNTILTTSHLVDPPPTCP